MSGAGMPATQGDFFVCDFFGAVPKHDLASMEHPLFSLSTRPDRRILSYEHKGTEMTITPSVKGRATIFDADILIFCISQLMAAINAGKPTSRTLTLTAHDLLVATGRETSGDGYKRLRDAFERLAGTRLTTNITTGPKDDPTETTTGFGLIEAWEIVRRTRAGRMGRQKAWRASVETLRKKSGSNSPRRVFRAMVRDIIAGDRLPDYVLEEEEGDIIAVRPRDVIERPLGMPQLKDQAGPVCAALMVHSLAGSKRTPQAVCHRRRSANAPIPQHRTVLKGRIYVSSAIKRRSRAVFDMRK